MTLKAVSYHRRCRTAPAATLAIWYPKRPTAPARTIMIMMRRIGIPSVVAVSCPKRATYVVIVYASAEHIEGRFIRASGSCIELLAMHMGTVETMSPIRDGPTVRLTPFEPVTGPRVAWHARRPACPQTRHRPNALQHHLRHRTRPEPFWPTQALDRWAQTPH